MLTYILFETNVCKLPDLLTKKSNTMVVHSIHIFDKQGRCLHNREYLRNNPSTMPPQEEEKLLFGMVHSLNSFCDKMSPLDGKQGNLSGSYSTSKYKLHFHETCTGLLFIMMTDLQVDCITKTLMNVYKDVYVKYAVRNPLVKFQQRIDSDLFNSKLDKLVFGLPFYQG